jgi:hypothetical protein
MIDYNVDKPDSVHSYNEDIDLLNRFFPCMWLDEVSHILLELCKRALTGKKINILEWGSGNSTFFFSKYLMGHDIDFKWVSLEYFVPWYNEMIKEIDVNRVSNNVELVLLSPTHEPDKNKQRQLPMYQYVDYPLSKDTSYDMVLIDGRKRSLCLRNTSKVLKKDGVVFLHDAERPWYHEYMHMYDGDFVTCNVCPQSVGGIQKMWKGSLKGVR